jgi:trimeric autotransporter adhesin
MPRRHASPRSPVAAASRLKLERLEDRSVPATFVVNTTGDTGAGTGLTGDLRYCITQANATPGADTIAFAIPGSGLQTITPQSVLPSITDAVTIDGYTQPGASANTLATGSDAVLLVELAGTSLGASADGLAITAAGTTVRGLVINRFRNANVIVTGAGATGNRIEGNFIGTDATGTSKAGTSRWGVVILSGASNNVVGGTTVAARNVISGNSNAGITIQDATDTPTTGNVISGNYIGTDLTGTTAVPNGAGVFISAADGNTVGGTTAAERNVVSANLLKGVQISDSSGNVVVGNYIGVDATGAVALGNGFQGIDIAGSTGTRIGGTLPGERNVISANGADGVVINFPDNVVQGNYIGTDATGQVALGNGRHGVNLSLQAENNLIGGMAAGAGNVISGNAADGVHLEGFADPPFSTFTVAGNVIRGNFIGTNAGGAVAVGNGQNGVTVGPLAADNTIGGSTIGAGNVISGNAQNGVLITGSATGTVVAGNLIGTDGTGKAAIPNGTVGVPFIGDGVRIDGAAGNTIGGTAAGARNVISGNVSDGVDLRSGATGNLVVGNYIGTDATGAVALGNQEDGVYFEGASGNSVGGLTAGERNVISGNDANGVFLYGPGSDNNLIRGNFIGTDAAGTGGVGNAFEGVFIWQDPASNPGGPGPSNNRIGGAAPGAGNLIAFNAGTGVTIGLDPTDQSRGNRIFGNSIRDNGDIGIDLGADGPTPNDAGDADAGPNQFQNRPRIAQSIASGGTRTVTGILRGTPNSTFRIELFASSSADPGGFGEGEVFLGLVNVSTDVAGNAAFTLACPDDPARLVVTATATNLATGDTSEFSAAVTTTAPPATAPTVTAPGNQTAIAATPTLIALGGFTDPDGGPWTVTVNWGDGSPSETFVAGAPGGLGSRPHTYLAAGQYAVTVSVSDGVGTGSASFVVTVLPLRLTAAGSGAGGGSLVKVYNPEGVERFTFLAYPGFQGEVRVATGDVTGDGVDDIVTGAGGGPNTGPHVKVFEGATGALLASFFAYSPAFNGGVSVAVGDVTGDGIGEIITGAGPGAGPHVKVFAVSGAELASFYAFDAGFSGGVNVGAADLDANGVSEILTGVASGASPHVRAFRFADLATVLSFFAFDPAFQGGVSVAGGSGFFVVGAGAGAGPHVRAYTGAGAEFASFFAFPTAPGGGVRVGIEGGPVPLILAGAGPGGAPAVRAFTTALTLAADFLAFDPSFPGGAFVG